MYDDKTLPAELTYASEQSPQRRLDLVPRRSLREEVVYRFRYCINAYPLLYMPIVRFRHRYSGDRVVNAETDLVIEAFGRTGTTFANFAFLAAQRRRVRTVHHTHAAAQVIAGVKMDIPTLVIVRQPEEVALSHMALHRISASSALTAWIRFHRRLLPFRKQIVFCRFDQMTQNFTPIIRQVNEAFGTNFDVWDHTKSNETEVFEQIKTRNRGRFREDQQEQRGRAFALPTLERESLKQRLRSQLQTPSLTRLRNEANRLYKILNDSENLPIVGRGTAKHAIFGEPH